MARFGLYSTARPQDHAGALQSAIREEDLATDCARLGMGVHGLDQCLHPPRLDFGIVVEQYPKLATGGLAAAIACPGQTEIDGRAQDLHPFYRFPQLHRRVLARLVEHRDRLVRKLAGTGSGQ